MNKHREFKVNGIKFFVTESNNSAWKWQAMMLSEKAWVRTAVYGNSINEVKEICKERF